MKTGGQIIPSIPVVIDAPTDETDPLTPPICFDGQDNDADGRTDFPLMSAVSLHPTLTSSMFATRIRVADYQSGKTPSSMIHRTAEQPSCAQSAGPEKIYVYENPYNARLTFSVDHPETIQRTLVYVRSSCVDARVNWAVTRAKALTAAERSV